MAANLQRYLTETNQSRESDLPLMLRNTKCVACHGFAPPGELFCDSCKSPRIRIEPEYKPD